MELVEYCQKNGIAVEAYSPIAHGEILNQPEIKTMADKYGVTVPQLCIRYTLQLGTITLPKTGNPYHMKSNVEVNFEINAEDMELLKNFKKIESYGENGIFPAPPLVKNTHFIIGGADPLLRHVYNLNPNPVLPSLLHLTHSVAMHFHPS